jgi:hypothetical protein
MTKRSIPTALALGALLGAAACGQDRTEEMYTDPGLEAAPPAAGADVYMEPVDTFSAESWETVEEGEAVPVEPVPPGEPGAGAPGEPAQEPML